MVSENNQWWQDEQEVAELIWCMAYLDRIVTPPSSQDIEEQDNLQHSHPESLTEHLSEDHTNIPPSETVEQQIPIATHRQQSSDVSTSPEPESSSNNYASPLLVFVWYVWSGERDEVRSLYEVRSLKSEVRSQWQN